MLKKQIILLLLIYHFTNTNVKSAEIFQYILNDPCFNTYQTEAIKHIKNPDIVIVKEAIGIIIRFELKNPRSEIKQLSPRTIAILKDIEFFLAKIKKPVIIEVHTEVVALNKRRGIKNWEFSTLIANKLESYIIQNSSTISKEHIKSVGYGEFKPAKNTPNNGGKYSNRVDIIIPCSINGE